MVNFLFTDVTFIKANTPIDGNVSDIEIYKHIKWSQDATILDALGTKLYESLGAAVLAHNPPTNTPYTALQQALLDRIDPALAHYVVYFYLLFARDKIKNNSIAASASDQNTPADNATVGTMQAQMKNRGDYYLAQLKLYLQINAADYPDYNDPSLPVYPNGDSPYDSGLFAYPVTAPVNSPLGLGYWNGNGMGGCCPGDYWSNGQYWDF